MDHTEPEHTSKRPGPNPAFDVITHMPQTPSQPGVVRHGAAVLPRPNRGRIVVRGSERLSFLHALLTNDVARLTAGSGCYAAFLTPQGRMIADMHLFELGDTLLLDVPAPVTDVLLAKFDQLLFSEDVQLGNVTEAFNCVDIRGPAAAGVVATVCGLDEASLAAWESHQNSRVTWHGEPAIVAAVRDAGLPGFWVYLPAGLTETLVAAVEAAGAVRINDREYEVTRIEAGQPVFLIDMTEDTIPLEAGLEHSAVSFTKGCFPGQEVLVRIRDRGQGRVAKRLVGLTIDGETVPSAGATIRRHGQDIGVVTSAVYSPTLGQIIALGYVHRDATDAGTSVSVSLNEQERSAVVTALPFVS